MWSNMLLFFTSSVWSLISIVLFSIDNDYQHEINGNNISTYVLGIYKEDELNTLEKFRPMVNDVLEKDYERTNQFLIRWLRACKLDLIAASEMLRKAQQWRKDYNMDTILLEKFPLLEEAKFNLCNINGFDNDGNPVFYLRGASQYDTRLLLMKGLKHDLIRKMNQCFERVIVKLRELTKSTGKDISQAVGVVDGYGYNLKQHACFECISLYLDFVRNYQKFYPEYIKLAVLVNAPRISKPIIEMIKPLLSSSTAKAIKVFGSDKKEWSTFLLKHIPSDQLPYDFGGTAKF